MFATRTMLGLVLVAILASGLTLGDLPASAAGQIDQDEVRAQAFIQIAVQAQKFATSLRDQAVSAGLDTTEMSASIQEGDELLEQAQNLFADGEYTKAVEMAREAMKRFSDAIRSLGKNVRERQEEVEKGIHEAVARARNRIERIRRILAHVTVNGQTQEVINNANGYLALAEKSLENAEQIIENDPGNASEAAQSLADANKNIGLAFKELRKIARLREAHRIDIFTRKVEKLINRLQNAIDSAASSGADVSEAQALLNQAKTALNNAKSSMQTGNIRDTIKDLKEFRKLLLSVLRELAKLRRGK